MIHEIAIKKLKNIIYKLSYKLNQIFKLPLKNIYSIILHDKLKYLYMLLELYIDFSIIKEIFIDFWHG